MITSSKRILICGLPGAGKTFLAERLLVQLGNASWFNADAIRKEFDDWDFSDDGRKRQMKRMKNLTSTAVADGKYAIADFVCPTNSLRKEFDADYIIWMNTITEGRFEDTNKVFENPAPGSVDIEITSTKWRNEGDADKWAVTIKNNLNKD